MDELVFAILLLALSFLLRVIFVLGGTSDDWVTWWIIYHQRGKALLFGNEEGYLFRIPDPLSAPVTSASP